jgi:hypothetical protein
MIALLVALAASWWDTGHRIVATIAFRELSHDQTRWLSDLFSLWPGENGTLITLASWQDDIKNAGYHISSMSNWHFTDIPYVPNSSAAVKIPPPTFNVSSILRDTLDLLMDSTTTAPWALSFSMRNLVHFVGDAHQPLHAVSLYDSRWPDGDAGGNRFNLPSEEFGANGNNLHKLWDSGGFSYQSPWPEAAFEYNLSKILTTHPRSAYADRIANLDPGAWVNESWTIAATFAYNLSNGTAPSEEYLVTARRYSETQLAVAGYRLGDILKKFFDQRGMLKLNLPTSLSEAGHPDVWTVNGIVAWVLVFICLVVSVVCKVIEHRRYREV